MTLSEWIKTYCTENSITLPDDIPDEKTALKFLKFNPVDGEAGDDGYKITLTGPNEASPALTIGVYIGEFTSDGYAYDLSFYDILANGATFVYNAPSDTLYFIPDYSVDTIEGNYTNVTSSWGQEGYLISGDCSLTTKY